LEFRFGSAQVCDLKFSADAKYLFASGRVPEVRMFEVDSGTPARTLRTHEKTIESIALSSDDQLLGCASNDEWASLWDWRQETVLQKTKPLDYRLTRIAMSPNGEYVVFASVKGEVEVRSLASWKTIRRTKVPSAVQSLAISPDSNFIAAGCRSGVIHLLRPSAESAAETAAKPGPDVPQAIFAHSGRVNDLVWISNRRISSVGDDGSMVVSRLDVQPQVLPVNAFDAKAICVSENGRWIGAHDYQQVKLIDTSNGKDIPLPNLQTVSNFAGIAFEPGGDRLFVSTADGKLLWNNVADPQQFGEITLPVVADYATIRFSDDGSRMLLCSRKNDVAIVVDTAEILVLLQTPCPDAYTGALSPDGRFLATSHRGDVLVYSVDSGELVKESTGHHSETINDLRFGPDGQWLVTCSDDRTIRLWRPWQDAESELIGVFPNGVPRAISLSRDGRTLISCARSGEVWTFNVPARQKLFAIARNSVGYADSQLSADDSTLVTLHCDGSLFWVRLK
jgi:WD40 repeat protein